MDEQMRSELSRLAQEYQEGIIPESLYQSRLAEIRADYIKRTSQSSNEFEYRESGATPSEALKKAIEVMRANRKCRPVPGFIPFSMFNNIPTPQYGAYPDKLPEEVPEPRKAIPNPNYRSPGPFSWPNEEAYEARFIPSDWFDRGEAEKAEKESTIMPIPVVGGPHDGDRLSGLADLALPKYEGYVIEALLATPSETPIRIAIPKDLPIHEAVIRLAKNYLRSSLDVQLEELRESIAALPDED